MAWTRAVLLACALLSGCASMTETQCRSADWYQLGYRDGDVYGLRPQIDQYAYQCRAWVQASEGDYLRGWVDGYREFTRRVHASDCCSP
jgi:hypothetical protein